jgi:hypothetical protein
MAGKSGSFRNPKSEKRANFPDISVKKRLATPNLPNGPFCAHPNTYPET